MEHTFDIEIAEKYGIFEAVLLNNLWFWVEHNRANEKNFYDGEYWTYNSVKAFSELFPYASEKKIRNALKNLKEVGIVKTGNYNKSNYDRTLWYAFTEKGKCIMTKGQMDSKKTENELSPNGEMDVLENGTPIPYVNALDQNALVNADDKTRASSSKIRKKVFFPEDEKLNEAFLDYIDMRKKIRSPMTDRAIELAIKELTKLSKDTFGDMNNDKAIEILNQSVMNSWKGLFPLKEDTAKKSGGGYDWENV